MGLSPPRGRILPRLERDSKSECLHVRNQNQGKILQMYPSDKFLGYDEEGILCWIPPIRCILVVDVYGLGFDPQKDESSQWMGLVSEQSIARERTWSPITSGPRSMQRARSAFPLSTRRTARPSSGD